MTEAKKLQIKERIQKKREERKNRQFWQMPENPTPLEWLTTIFARTSDEKESKNRNDRLEHLNQLICKLQ